MGMAVAANAWASPTTGESHAKDEHLGWTRKTVDLLRSMIRQQEDDLNDLRAHLCAAEAQLASADN